jgi:endoglucanase
MNINLNTKTITNLTLTTLIFALLINTINVNSEQYNPTVNKHNYTQNELQAIAINSWNHYKQKFIINDERVLDKEDNSTTSEGQSYTMLRAIMVNDKNVFDRTYNWTKNNLQIRKTDNLFAWKTNVDAHGRTYNTLAMNATDADLDIGLALALADRKWNSYGNINYQQELKKLIKDIYTERVADINGLKIILPYNSQKWRGIEIINPSYFNPVAYKLFANYDPDHNWNRLADDAYQFINWLHYQNGLIPDWVEFNYNTYKFETYPRNLKYGDDNFGYEAFRTYYRMNLDYNLFGSQQAKRIIDSAQWFFEHEYQNNKKIASVYNKYGDSVERYEDMTTISSTYFIFKNTNSRMHNQFATDKLLSKINPNTMQFNQNDNYYSSNWGWFALADKAGMYLIE